MNMNEPMFDFPCSPSFREYEQWLIGNGLYREEPQVVVKYKGKETIKTIFIPDKRKNIEINSREDITHRFYK